jgi:Xaa-Pro aminopeptidase
MMYEKRWTAVIRELAESGLKVFVVQNPSNIRYLSCSNLYTAAPPTYLLFTNKGGPIAVTSWLESNRTDTECCVPEIRIWGNLPGKKAYAKKGQQALAKLLKELGAKKVLSDRPVSGIPVKAKVTGCIERMRSVKDSGELALIRKATALADAGARMLPRFVKNGSTELQAANELDYFLRKKGAQAIAFPTIIAAGAHSAYPHHDNSNTVIRNTSVICDFGVYVEGYCSDITRTILAGKPDERLVEVYDAVRESVKAGTKIIRPGVSLRKVDEACREVLRVRGLDGYYIHSTGHGIGLEVHESPYASPSSKEVAKKGMVFTVEPGVYIPKLGGVRIENDVLVTSNGYEVLTKSPY